MITVVISKKLLYVFHNLKYFNYKYFDNLSIKYININRKLLKLSRHSYEAKKLINRKSNKNSGNCLLKYFHYVIQKVRKRAKLNGWWSGDSGILRKEKD